MKRLIYASQATEDLDPDQLVVVPRQQALVSLMVGAARAFDLAVVAEGIEDRSTLELMRDLGCDLGQGYHLARPMPAADEPGWLRSRTAVTAWPPAHLRPTALPEAALPEAALPTAACPSPSSGERARWAHDRHP